jgi:hypothetical protein
MSWQSSNLRGLDSPAHEIRRWVPNSATRIMLFIRVCCGIFSR